MSSAWARRTAQGGIVLATACSAFTLGCKGGAGEASKPPTETADAAPSPIAALSFSVDPGLACANGKGICVAPSQVVTFGVTGIPGTIVSLSLQGDYADAALTAETLTLQTTPVLVTLASASSTALFTIVARVGSAASVQTVSLGVTVATSGLATVEAAAVYSGLRPRPEFYATDFVLSTCAELAANPPDLDAGAATWTPGPDGVAIALSIPAGERAAVEVRLGHYAFGCADVDPLVPDAMNSLPVEVYDVPLALGLTNLNASFSYSPDATAAAAWQAVTQAAAARVGAAFFPAGQGDGPALLDAMRVALVAPNDQAQFDALRQSGSWDSLATSWMGTHTPGIASRASTWLATAAGDGMGPLAVDIGNGTAAGTAPVTVAGFGSLTWVSAGLSQPAAFQWSADANDTIHLAGAIDLTTTPLLAHEADLAAAVAVSGATDVPSALALGIDCTGLAAKLLAVTGVSYAGCAAACTANLCHAAFTTAWSAAAAAAGDGSDLVHTTITASAPADVGDNAEPAYVQGGWLGSVSGPGVPSAVDGGFAVSGALLATEPVAAP